MSSEGLGAWRFRLLGLTLLALLLGEAALPAGTSGEVALGLIGVAFVAAMVFAVGPGFVSWPLTLALATPIGFELWLSHEASWKTVAGSWAHFPLLGLATLATGRQLVRAERAGGDLIAGSLCTYILAACTFASLYAGIERAWPGAFVGPAASDFHQLLYFSFVTITTLGYGDVLAVHPGVQALVSLEAAVGVLFTSVVVARVVGLAAGGGGRPFAPPGTDARGGRYPFLAALLVVTLLLLPWLEGRTFGSLGLGLLLAGQLFGALYGCQGGPAATRVGVVLAGVALLTAAWPGTTSAKVIGQAALSAFFALAVGVLIAWLARTRTVTREAVFAAVAVYFLLGLCLGSVFALADALHPGSIAFPDGSEPSRGRYVYFGFMTLTTTGFGEVVPTTGPAEKIAALGALLGVFYPSVLVARLVTLYSSDREPTAL